MKRWLFETICVGMLLRIMPTTDPTRTEQPPATPPLIAQTLVREGEFAVKLV